MTAAELGQRFLEPGLLFKSPIDPISLGMALVLGTAGLPHILMRFFTVPTAQRARKSVIWAMGIIGGFYVLTLFLGTGAAIHVGALDTMAIDRGGNMAAPLLAQFLGGGKDSILGNLMLAFVAAVAFATIVAVAASANLPVVLLALYWKKCNTGGVVAGLVVGTFAAIGRVLVSSNMTDPLPVKAAQERIIKAQDERIAKLGADLPGLADAAAQEKARAGIAAAEKARKAAEATIAGLGGAMTSLVGLEKPLFELRNPGLISIPLGFLAVFLGSLLYRDKRAEEMWDELDVRSNTGIGRAAASAH